MAVMVWCQSCHTVVWAYDHQQPVDLRGICNMLNLPCPKCGEAGNFDGWEAKDAYEKLFQRYESSKVVYDDWSAMKEIARLEGVNWEPSGNNHWFNDSF